MKQKHANRSRTEIVREILEIVNDYYIESDGVTRIKLTHLVYLSSAQLKEYLVILTTHHLLVHNSTNRRYRMTKKGLRFLEIYYKLRDMISEGEEVEQEIDYSELPRM
jgi:predicted transcriptional regulator